MLWLAALYELLWSVQLLILSTMVVMCWARLIPNADGMCTCVPVCGDRLRRTF